MSGNQPPVVHEPRPNRLSIGDRTVVVIAGVILATVPSIIGPMVRDWLQSEPPMSAPEYRRDMQDMRDLARQALTLAKANAVQLGAAMPLNVAIEKFKAVNARMDSEHARITGVQQDAKDNRQAIQRYLYGRDSAYLAIPPFRPGAVGPPPHRYPVSRLTPKRPPDYRKPDSSEEQAYGPNRKDRDMAPQFQALVDSYPHGHGGTECVSVVARRDFCGAVGDALVSAPAFTRLVRGPDDGAGDRRRDRPQYPTEGA